MYNIYFLQKLHSFSKRKNRIPTILKSLVQFALEEALSKQKKKKKKKWSTTWNKEFQKRIENFLFLQIAKFCLRIKMSY